MRDLERDGFIASACLHLSAELHVLQSPTTRLFCSVASTVTGSEASLRRRFDLDADCIDSRLSRSIFSSISDADEALARQPIAYDVRADCFFALDAGWTLPSPAVRRPSAVFVQY